MSTGTSACASNSAWARIFCIAGLTLRKNSSSPSDSISSLAISASASSFVDPTWALIRKSSCASLKGRTRTSLAPRRVASFSRSASSGEPSTTTGRSGQRRRNHGKRCRLSASPRGRSKNKRVGAASDCTRSIASQPLATVSRCQELESAMDQSRRRTAESLLTASKRTVSIVCGDMSERSLPTERGECFWENELRESSGRFYFVSFYANRERALDCIYGNNQGTVSITRDQDAFHAIECATSDAHALPDLEERMRRPREWTFNHVPNRTDLSARNRCALAPRADEPEDPVHAKNPQAVGSVGRKPGEHIATK